MENNKMNLHVMNLSHYEAPVVTEDRRKEWVGYGEDNDFYGYIIEMYQNSTTNAAIIDGVVNQIFGKGIDATDSARKAGQYAAMRSIIRDSHLRNVCQDLKMFGEASVQVLYRDGVVVSTEFFPRNTLRAEKFNDEGVIEAYYYHPRWEDMRPGDEPTRIPTFGNGNGNEPEVKIIKKYSIGNDYYTNPDYLAGLNYAMMESEISTYLINEIQNSFSGTKVVNFNNGIPTPEQQRQIKNDVLSKLTGSRGEKVIVAFNSNAESQTTVEDISLTNSSELYSYLSEEATRKLMLAHKITSPLLIGIRTENNGLGSNADEIKNAAALFHNIVVKPYQDLIIEAYKDILAVNDISLDLYIKSIQPLEFTEVEVEDLDDAEQEKEVGRDVSFMKQIRDFFTYQDNIEINTEEE